MKNKDKITDAVVKENPHIVKKVKRLPKESWFVITQVTHNAIMAKIETLLKSLTITRLEFHPNSWTF
jgi:hypothetical protein